MKSPRTKNPHSLRLARAAAYARLVDIAEQAIVLLDALDGDPDFEPNDELFQDLNPISFQSANVIPTKRIRKAV